MSVYKRLGATDVIANTNTLLYTVPAAKSAVVSTISVCNTGTDPGTFRVAIIPGELSAISKKDHIYYDLPLAGNDTFMATIGLTISAGYSIAVYGSSSDIVFSSFGSEVG